MKVGLTFCSVKPVEFKKSIAICHDFDFKDLKFNLWAIKIRSVKGNSSHELYSNIEAR